MVSGDVKNFLLYRKERESNPNNRISSINPNMPLSSTIFNVLVYLSEQILYRM